MRRSFRKDSAKSHQGLLMFNRYILLLQIYSFRRPLAKWSFSLTISWPLKCSRTWPLVRTVQPRDQSHLGVDIECIFSSFRVPSQTGRYQDRSKKVRLPARFRQQDDEEDRLQSSLRSRSIGQLFQIQGLKPESNILVNKGGFFQISHADGLPAAESFTEESLSNEEVLKKLHEVLLEIEVIEGELTCPETGRKFPIVNGIPNMLVNEDEVA